MSSRTRAVLADPPELCVVSPSPRGDVATSPLFRNRPELRLDAGSARPASRSPPPARQRDLEIAICESRPIIFDGERRGRLRLDGDAEAMRRRRRFRRLRPAASVQPPRAGCSTTSVRARVFVAHRVGRGAAFLGLLDQHAARDADAADARRRAIALRVDDHAEVDRVREQPALAGLSGSIRPSPANAWPSITEKLPPSSVRPVLLVSQTARSGRARRMRRVPQRDLLGLDVRLQDRHERRLVLANRDWLFQLVLEQSRRAAPPAASTCCASRAARCPRRGRRRRRRHHRRAPPPARAEAPGLRRRRRRRRPHHRRHRRS